MKRVGILAFGGESSGGIYQYTISMIEAFSYDSSNKYIVLTTEGNNLFDNLGLEIRKIPPLKTNVVKILLKALFSYSGLKAMFLLTKNEKEAFKDIDIFVSPIISPFPHIFMKKPYIFSLHDMQERYFPEFFTWKDNLKRYLLNRVVSKYAKKIICESHYVKSDIVKFLKVDESKIEVIPAPPPKGLVKEYEEQELKEIRIKYDLPSEYLFYPAAQFWLHKNHLRLIEAFKLVADKNENIHLVLTGNNKGVFLQKKL